MAFWPEGAVVPAALRATDLVLRMLGPERVERDDEAIMETRTRLRRWSHSGWPSDDITVDDNMVDMLVHERKHSARSIRLHRPQPRRDAGRGLHVRRSVIQVAGASRPGCQRRSGAPARSPIVA